LLAIALVLGALAAPAFAGPDDPLFGNLTTDDGHRANMGTVFGKNQMERGHPLTIFLNDRAVHIGSCASSSKFTDQQKVIGELIGKEATVLICPMCMKHYGLKEADLLPGVKVGNPELTGGLLFKDNTQTMTW